MTYEAPRRTCLPPGLAGIVILMLPLVTGLASAQELTGQDARSLDGQVQEIKSDVLSIAAELSALEERLLFPSNTQLAVFVSLAANDEFRLDSLAIEVDGEPVTHHIYSFNELEALRKGGVQRIYTGNVSTGDHEISVTMSGKLDSGKDFAESGKFAFVKGVKPKALGIVLDRPQSGAGAIQVGNW